MSACKHWHFGLHVYLCYTKTTRLYKCHETFTFCDLGEAVITFSTVGFGDIAPKSKLGRCVGSFFMIFGVASFGHLAAWMNLIPNLFLFLFLSFTRSKGGSVFGSWYGLESLQKGRSVYRTAMDLPRTFVQENSPLPYRIPHLYTLGFPQCGKDQEVYINDNGSPSAKCQRTRTHTHTRQEWIIIWSGRNWVLWHAY